MIPKSCSRSTFPNRAQLRTEGCILYALGLGLGQDPMDENELAFVYEKNLKVLPTFPVVQGYSA